MFSSLQRRITRTYVLLAIVLIVLVVLASTVLAFLLYARGVGDALAGASQRVADAARGIPRSTPLQRSAPKLLSAVQRSRFHVLIVDDRGKPIAQNEREGPPGAGRAIVIAIGRAIGLPRAVIPVPGGRAIIAADFDRFGAVLLWYWSIMLPIGILAAAAAWVVGRRITSGALVPLGEVTHALRGIASGDFSPQRLLGESRDLRELTSAYNDVAYALARSAAERAETEAHMRQFIADAGHELRTPLTVIMGYLDALRAGIVQGSEATARTYETMLDESRKMRALIEKLIFLARLDRAKAPARAAPIDLAALCLRVVRSLAPLADSRIDADLRDEGAVAVADESELSEAIKNVLENALKYAPASRVSLQVRREGENACVTIRDDGPGMDEQDLQHAFDRFYRGSARGETEGSGLGLAIAKRAVERAGGTIAIENAQGGGTRVRMCLPSVTAAEKPAASG